MKDQRTQDSLTYYGKYSKDKKVFCLTIGHEELHIPENWSFGRALKKSGSVELEDTDSHFVEIISSLLNRRIEKIRFSIQDSLVEAVLEFNEESKTPHLYAS